MNWSKGYVVNQGYTYGYYHEISPLALTWASLIRGHITPLNKFNYLELGCGQGMSLIINAANHPDSNFVGIDFMPDHIQHARDLSNKLGLKNIEFHEFDFTHQSLDVFSNRKFQYITAHGITTWISLEVRQAMSYLVNELLDTGGVFYNSYNTPQYWQHLISFQHLARTIAKQEGGVNGLNRAKDIFDFINGSMNDFFDQNPHLKKKLDGFKDQSVDYLVHEFCNQNWRLVFFDEEQKLNSEIKLNYLGSANLLENFDKCFPVDLHEKTKNESSINKELIKDIYLGQAFRRDLWVRGRPQSTIHEQIKLVCQLGLTKSVSRKTREVLDSITVQSGGIKIETKNPIILDLIVKTEKSNCGLSHLKSEMEKDLTEIYRLVSLLLASGDAILTFDDSIEPVNINQALIELASEGKPYGWLQASKTKSGVSVSTLEMMLLKAILSCDSEESVAEQVSIEFKKRGNQLVIEGKELSGKDAIDYFIQYIKQNTFLEKIGKLQNQGVVNSKLFLIK